MHSHFFHLSPEPHGQGSFLPGFLSLRAGRGFSAIDQLMHDPEAELVAVCDNYLPVLEEKKKELGTENIVALEKGIPNLLRHVSNIKNVYKLPCVVAVNRFPTDTDKEIDFIIKKCRELGVNTVLSTVWAEGGKGGEALAREVVRLCEEEKGDFTFSYELDCSIKEKIEAIVKKIYHGDGVLFTANAEKQIKTLTELGYDKMPICMAKTQYSFTDDQTKLGAPEGFTITVRNIKVSAGAGFLVALTGDIMTMPGLPKVPSAEKIDVDENGKITGLF